MAWKSPFLIFQEFLSPLLSEEVIEYMDVTIPDYDVDGKPIPGTRHNKLAESIIFDRLQPLITTIEKHYDVEYRGTEKMLFEWYPQTCQGESPHCENSEYLRKNWVKVRDRDFTCVIFLCEYQLSAQRRGALPGPDSRL